MGGCLKKHRCWLEFCKRQMLWFICVIAELILAVQFTDCEIMMCH